MPLATARAAAASTAAADSTAAAANVAAIAARGPAPSALRTGAADAAAAGSSFSAAAAGRRREGGKGGAAERLFRASPVAAATPPSAPASPATAAATHDLSSPPLSATAAPVPEAPEASAAPALPAAFLQAAARVAQQELSSLYPLQAAAALGPLAASTATQPDADAATPPAAPAATQEAAAAETAGTAAETAAGAAAGRAAATPSSSPHTASLRLLPSFPSSFPSPSLPSEAAAVQRRRGPLVRGEVLEKVDDLLLLLDATEDDTAAAVLQVLQQRFSVGQYDTCCGGNLLLRVSPSGHRSSNYASSSSSTPERSSRHSSTNGRSSWGGREEGEGVEGERAAAGAARGEAQAPFLLEDFSLWNRWRYCERDVGLLPAHPYLLLRKAVQNAALKKKNQLLLVLGSSGASACTAAVQQALAEYLFTFSPRPYPAYPYQQQTLLQEADAKARRSALFDVVKRVSAAFAVEPVATAASSSPSSFFPAAGAAASPASASSVAAVGGNEAQGTTSCVRNFDFVRADFAADGTLLRFTAFPNLSYEPSSGCVEGSGRLLCSESEEGRRLPAANVFYMLLGTLKQRGITDQDEGTEEDEEAAAEEEEEDGQEEQQQTGKQQKKRRRRGSRRREAQQQRDAGEEEKEGHEGEEEEEARLLQNCGVQAYEADALLQLLPPSRVLLQGPQQQRAACMRFLRDLKRLGCSLQDVADALRILLASLFAEAIFLGLKQKRREEEQQRQAAEDNAAEAGGEQQQGQGEEQPHPSAVVPQQFSFDQDRPLLLGVDLISVLADLLGLEDRLLGCLYTDSTVSWETETLPLKLFCWLRCWLHAQFCRALEVAPPPGAPPPVASLGLIAGAGIAGEQQPGGSGGSLLPLLRNYNEEILYNIYLRAAFLKDAELFVSEEVEAPRMQEEAAAELSSSDLLMNLLGGQSFPTASLATAAGGAGPSSSPAAAAADAAPVRATGLPLLLQELHRSYEGEFVEQRLHGPTNAGATFVHRLQREAAALSLSAFQLLPKAAEEPQKGEAAEQQPPGLRAPQRIIIKKKMPRAAPSLRVQQHLPAAGDWPRVIRDTSGFPRKSPLLSQFLIRHTTGEVIKYDARAFVAANAAPFSLPPELLAVLQRSADLPLLRRLLQSSPTAEPHTDSSSPSNEDHVYNLRLSPSSLRSDLVLQAQQDTLLPPALPQQQQEQEAGIDAHYIICLTAAPEDAAAAAELGAASVTPPPASPAAAATAAISSPFSQEATAAPRFDCDYVRQQLQRLQIFRYIDLQRLGWGMHFSFDAFVLLYAILFVPPLPASLLPAPVQQQQQLRRTRQQRAEQRFQTRMQSLLFDEQTLREKPRKARQAAVFLLRAFLVPADEYALGKTRVFLKRQAFLALELRRVQYLQRVLPGVRTLHRAWRGFRARLFRAEMRAVAVRMQSHMRRQLQQAAAAAAAHSVHLFFGALLLTHFLFQHKRVGLPREQLDVIEKAYREKELFCLRWAAAVFMQKWWRGCLARTKANERRRELLLLLASQLIQNYWRRYRAQATLLEKIELHIIPTKAATKIQAEVRRWIQQRRYQRMRGLALAILSVRRKGSKLYSLSVELNYRPVLKNTRVMRDMLAAHDQQAITQIQSLFRMAHVRRQFVELRRAVTLCQAAALTRLRRYEFLKAKQAVIFLQRWWRARRRLLQLRIDTAVSAAPRLPASSLPFVAARERAAAAQLREPLLAAQGVFFDVSTYRGGAGGAAIDAPPFLQFIDFKVHGDIRDVYTQTWAYPLKRLLEQVEHQIRAAADVLRAIDWGPPLRVLQVVVGGQHSLVLLQQRVLVLQQDLATRVSCGRTRPTSEDVFESKPLVYSWGWNDLGQLGSPAEAPAVADRGAACVGPLSFVDATFKNYLDKRTGRLRQVLQREVDYSFHVSWVGAGTDHCAALIDNGMVFCWGDNRVGQCGLGHRITHAYRPEMLRFFQENRLQAVHAATGAQHTAVITADGCCYMWGAHAFVAFDTIPEGSNFFTPVAVPLPPAAVPTQVACGFGFNVLAVRGAAGVFVWGNNDRGQLGTGEERRARREAPVFVPLRPPPAAAAAPSPASAAAAGGARQHLAPAAGAAAASASGSPAAAAPSSSSSPTSSSGPFFSLGRLLVEKVAAGPDFVVACVSPARGCMYTWGAHTVTIAPVSPAATAAGAAARAAGVNIFARMQQQQQLRGFAGAPKAGVKFAGPDRKRGSVGPGAAAAAKIGGAAGGSKEQQQLRWTTRRAITSPTVVQHELWKGRRIKDIACGPRQTVVVTDLGVVYGFRSFTVRWLAPEGGEKQEASAAASTAPATAAAALSPFFRRPQQQQEKQEQEKRQQAEAAAAAAPSAVFKSVKGSYTLQPGLFSFLWAKPSRTAVQKIHCSYNSVSCSTYWATAVRRTRRFVDNEIASMTPNVLQEQFSCTGEPLQFPPSVVAKAQQRQREVQQELEAPFVGQKQPQPSDFHTRLGEQALAESVPDPRLIAHMRGAYTGEPE